MNRTDARLTDVEAAVRVLHARVISLEQHAGVAQAPPVPVAAPAIPAPAPAPTPTRTSPRPAAVPRPRATASRFGPRELEELVGGRLLAWIGGAAVLLGLAFFFALAVSNGWIDEGMRTMLAGAGSLGLLTLGVWLYECRSRTEAAMAAAATGLAGVFLTTVVASQVYGLVGPMPALILALGAAGGGTLLALRWNAQVIGAIAILGGALAPVLAGAPADSSTMVLLLVATAAGAGVLVQKQWNWLAVALFCVVTPQWAPWAATSDSPTTVMLGLVAFGAVGLIGAIGFELRSAADDLRRSAAFLLATNALVVGAVGWIGFHGAGAPLAAKACLVVLAIVHLAVGTSMRLEPRISRDLSVVSLAIGLVLVDVAWAAVVDGPGVAVGWALSAAGLALLASRDSLRRVERDAALVGLGGQITVALGHVLTRHVPPAAIETAPSVDGVVALASLAAASLVCGALTDPARREIRALLDGLGLASVAYLSAVVLDGAVLAATFAGEAVLLSHVARARRDSSAQVGAFAFLGMAALHALAFEAPGGAFLYGAESVAALGLAFGAVTLATLRVAATLDLPAGWKPRLVTGAAVAALYAVSVAIVTAFQPGLEAVDSTLLDLGVRQKGQMLVSGLWSLVGAAALVAGLTRDRRELRIAGLALLAAAVAKVFLFDLATLTSVYRVISFIGVGLVLLAGSYAWQRLRPAPLPDLRNA